MSNNKELREKLTSLLPGYKWTVHKSEPGDWQEATGIQSAGFNRLSTIGVTVKESGQWYEMKVAGHGTHAKWSAAGCGKTLAKAARMMQEALEWKANFYAGLASMVRAARAQKGGAK